MTPAVVELEDSTAAGVQEAVARQPGQATLHLREASGLEATVEVVVADLAHVVLEPPLGGPLLGARDDSSRTVSNILSGGPLVVPLRFLATLPSGSTEELWSGPFHTAGLRFACEPSEPELRAFFDFEPWDAATAAAEASDDAGFPPAWKSGGPGGTPQAACLLRPRPVEVKDWIGRAPRGTFDLRVSVPTSRPGAEGPVAATTTLDFQPQFAVLGPSGARLAPGEVCATLTAAQPAAAIEVWTGGHPVEATLLALPRDDSVRLRVHAKQAGSTVVLEWASPAARSGVEEELEVQLTSPASGQVLLLRLRLDGRSSGALAMPQTELMSSLWLVRLATLGVASAGLHALITGCGSSRLIHGAGPDSWPVLTPHTPPVAAFRGGLALDGSPFQKVGMQF